MFWGRSKAKICAYPLIYSLTPILENLITWSKLTLANDVKANVKVVEAVRFDSGLGFNVGVTPALHSRGCCHLPDFQSQGFPNIVRTTLRERGEYN